MKSRFGMKNSKDVVINNIKNVDDLTELEKLILVEIVKNSNVTRYIVFYNWYNLVTYSKRYRPMKEKKIY